MLPLATACQNAISAGKFSQIHLVCWVSSPGYRPEMLGACLEIDRCDRKELHCGRRHRFNR
jgi:hypothetical protein